MPQINVKEIDQSVVTRVVSDNRVKILVPVIASFGPTMDETENAVNTFTDVTQYDRVYGYTPAQFNPFKNDNSRTYARELIKKGSAVSVVRVNAGSVASFDIGATVATTSTQLYTAVPKSAMMSAEFLSDCEKVTDATVSLTHSAASGSDPAQATGTISGLVKLVPGTFKMSGTMATSTAVECYDGGVNSSGKGVLVFTKGTGLAGTIDYATAEVVITGTTGNITGTAAGYHVKSTVTDFTKYTFAPQISSITAKYSGSFGNNIMVCISAINTTRLSESFQYANISVYYVDRTVVYDSEGNVDYSKTVVNGTTLLENKMVTTNPDDPRYFEDVEFDFIKINASTNARNELALVWSNITADTESDVLYPGFPVIPFRIATPDSTYSYAYNNFAFSNTFGTDFPFYDGDTADTKVLTALKKGFKGYAVGTSGTDVTQGLVNSYLSQVYEGDSTHVAIHDLVQGNIIDMYQQFTDPYIYDFDFITSGGFVYESYELDGTDVKTAVVTVPVGGNSGVIYNTVNPIHNAMRNLVESRKDCIALFDVPSNYDPKQLVEYSRMLNTSYGTMHFPWCYVASPYTSGMQIKMCPSYIFLYTFLQNLDLNIDAQKWFPPAGVTRATARVVKRPDFEVGSVLLNDWQNDNTSRVNPIMRLKQYGYVIYGQYTCLEAISLNTHSALESLNVRLIANVVKKAIFDVCLNLAFEPNTKNLWNKFYAQMDEKLRYMMYNDGLYDYKIVMDESTVTTDDINHLRCPGKVYIAPTRTAEFFDIDFIITEAGAQFNS